MHNPHAELLERFNKVESLINYLINGNGSAAIPTVHPLSPATRQEAAKHLGISLPTLDTLIKTNQLPAFNIGRKVRVRWSDLEEYVNKKGFKNAA